MAGFAGDEVEGPESPAMSGAQGARGDDVDKAGAVYGGDAAFHLVRLCITLCMLCVEMQKKLLELH